MICWLNFDVVNGSKGVDKSCQTILVFDLSSLFFTKSQNVYSILGQNEEIVGIEQEPFYW